MTSKEKTRFRQTVVWKRFRSFMIDKHKKACQMCGGVHKSTRGLQVHHLYPDQYTEIAPEMFAVLCADCHETVEKWAKRICGKKFSKPANFDKWHQLIGEYLPHPASERALELVKTIKQELEK